jgi:two-component system LytT family response regulator
VTLRALVVDDEAVARRRVCRLLRKLPGVEIIGQCGDGAAAIDAITSLRPDVVLLDVQMPEFDGFQVLQSIDADAALDVVFVTAHDRYALRAFDVHALDYLLKPITEERLAAALDRVRTHRRGREGRDPRLAKLLDQLVADRRHLTRLAARTGDRWTIIELNTVEWISAADNYVTLHAGGREFLVRGTLTWLERELDPAVFARIHRSTMIRVDRIREIVPESHGDMTIVLKDGTALALSRGYRAAIARLLQGRATAQRVSGHSTGA